MGEDGEVTGLLDCKVGDELYKKGDGTPWTVAGFHTASGDLWLERAVGRRREAATVTAATAGNWEKAREAATVTASTARLWEKTDA